MAMRESMQKEEGWIYIRYVQWVVSVEVRIRPHFGLL